MNKKELIDHIETQRRFNPDYGLNDVIKDIDELTEPHGFWYNNGLDYRYRCSVCGFHFESVGGLGLPWGYCANCGARMDKNPMENHKKY